MTEVKNYGEKTTTKLEGDRSNDNTVPDEMLHLLVKRKTINYNNKKIKNKKNNNKKQQQLNQAHIKLWLARMFASKS